MSQDNHSHDRRNSQSLHIRPGSSADLPALNNIFVDSVWDLAWRIGIQDGEHIASAEERANELRQWQPIRDHLAATSDQFWIAEHDGEPVGYARSILRDGVRELTEFFVSPQAQTNGIGRELLARAMPPGARRSYIIATLDLRAQARYHKLGVYQICAIYTFHRKPERVELEKEQSNDLEIVSITPDHIPMLAHLDVAIHGHRRHEDHNWLMQNRTGYLMLRHNRAVGYGYVGPYSGPFVMLDEADYPAALAHAESTAAAQGLEDFGLDVPMLNRRAIDYLLGRGYQMGQFFCFYMCSAHPLHVDKTIITSPMIMI